MVVEFNSTRIDLTPWVDEVKELFVPPDFVDEPNPTFIAIGAPSASPSNNLPTILADVYETTLGLFGRFKKRLIQISPVVG
ncbi:MAG: hypothetical protein ACRBCS_15040 [Cellvibrionaceae bacterium]